MSNNPTGMRWWVAVATLLTLAAIASRDIILMYFAFIFLDRNITRIINTQVNSRNAARAQLALRLAVVAAGVTHAGVKLRYGDESDLRDMGRLLQIALVTGYGVFALWDFNRVKRIPWR